MTGDDERSTRRPTPDGTSTPVTPAPTTVSPGTATVGSAAPGTASDGTAIDGTTVDGMASDATASDAPASDAPATAAGSARQTSATAATDAARQPSAGRLKLTRWLVDHTKNLLAPLVGSVAARIVNQLLGVALFVVAAGSIARAASTGAVALLPLAGTLVGLALVKALLRYLEHYLGHWVAFTALQRLRELFFSRLAPQAPAATAGRAGAELTERATRDIDRIEVFFAHTLPPAVSAGVVPAVALSWLAAVTDARLALAIAPFVAVIVVLLPLLAARSTWRSAERVGRARGAIATEVGDDVQGVREILAFGAERQRLRRLDAADAALTRARSGEGRVRGVRAGLVVLLQTGALVAVVIVGTSIGADAPTIATALAVGVGLWAPTRGVDEFLAGLDGAFAATARVCRVVDAEAPVRDPVVPRTAGAEASAALRGVTVRYPGDARPALDDVDATFPAGSWTAVVGVSGSGKSTLGALLPRGRDADTGTVTLGGTDVRDLALDELRGRVALVSQRPTLLRGTLADNLRLAAPDASDEELHAALRIAALDEWIDALPDGLETATGERGAAVSGGQLQRLALARALVAHPTVLVLDEALSQLDAETAASVRARLREHRPGLTVVEITHRADLVPDDDRVVVIDAGRVVETGTAGELRERAGAFRHLEARADA